MRPHFAKVEPKRIQNFGISPTGARAVFEAWGEIFTVPTDKGDIRNLTHSPAVADRDPAWSPDGKSVAYFTDESGEYELAIRDQNGLGTVRRINLGNPPSFFYTPTWSPDSKKIAYIDKRLQLWYLELDNPAPKLIDTDYYWTFAPNTISQTGLPTSKSDRLIRQLPSGSHAVFVYSLDQGESFQITDGMSDALNPVWTRTASISTSQLQPNRAGDRGSRHVERRASRHTQRLRRESYKDESRRSLPESDEEKPKDEKKPDLDKDKDKAEAQASDKDKAKDKHKASDATAADKGKDDKDKDKDKKGLARRTHISIPGMSRRDDGRSHVRGRWREAGDEEGQSRIARRRLQSRKWPLPFR